MSEASVSEVKLGSRRLASLDAMRGLAILSMIPTHILLFGALWAGGGWGTTGDTGLDLIVVDFSKPLGTGLIIFFFVTGMSLTLSMTKRRAKQGFLGIAGRVLLRYGSYVILGALFEVILWMLLSGGEMDLLGVLQAIFAGATFSGPILGVGLTAIVAFPLILYLSWKKLTLAASVIAPVVGLLLYFVVVPNYASLPEVSVLNPLIIEGWSILKAMPMMLIGAAVAKLLLEGRDMKLLLGLIGGVITWAYMIIPALLGSGMLHMVLAVWAYPHAMVFTIAAGLTMYAIFRVLETRKVNLSPMTVVGRAPLQVYYGHWFVFFTLFMVVGFANLTGIALLGIMVVTLGIVWPLCYVYARWRWGHPSSW